MQTGASLVALVVENLPANAGNMRGVGSIPGSGRSPGVGNGNPLQYSCLENLIDRAAWRATVHGVAKSWTWLKQLSTQTQVQADMLVEPHGNHNHIEFISTHRLFSRDNHWAAQTKTGGRVEGKGRTSVSFKPSGEEWLSLQERQEETQTLLPQGTKDLNWWEKAANPVALQGTGKALLQLENWEKWNKQTKSPQSKTSNPEEWPGHCLLLEVIMLREGQDPQNPATQSPPHNEPGTGPQETVFLPHHHKQSSKYQVTSRLLLGGAHELGGAPLSDKSTESLKAESGTVTLRKNKNKTFRKSAPTLSRK